jgi:hypothetical protein
VLLWYKPLERERERKSPNPDGIWIFYFEAEKLKTSESKVRSFMLFRLPLLADRAKEALEDQKKREKYDEPENNTVEQGGQSTTQLRKEMDSEESGKKKRETIFISLGFFEEKKEKSKSIKIQQKNRERK